MTIQPVELIPHPFRKDALVFAMDASIQVRDALKAEYGDRPVVRYCGTDMSEDRYGTVIDPRGWVMDHYLKNPAFCFAHKHDWPLMGNTIKLTNRGTAWDFDVEFAIEEWDIPNMPNLPKLIYNLVSKNRMPGCSVGMLPLKFEPYESTTVSPITARNKRFTQQELMELSSTPLPANRNGLKRAIAEGDLSDNEVILLGLHKFMLADTPIELFSFTGKELVRVIHPSEMRGVEVSNIDEFRTAVEERASVTAVASPSSPEQTFILESIDFEWQNVQRLMAVYPSIQNEDVQWYCQYGIERGMSNMNTLRRVLKNNYGQQVQVRDGEREAASLIETFNIESELETRVGKKISAKNKARLAQLQKLLSELLEEAGEVETERDAAEIIEVTPVVDVQQIRAMFGARVFGPTANNTTAAEENRGDDSAHGSSAPVSAVADVLKRYRTEVRGIS